MEIAGDDPYDSIVPLCHVSSSQEERLLRCPFAPEPYDPGDGASPEPSSPSDSGAGGGIRIASTPIAMVSLPDSEDEEEKNGGNDEFVTPPEEAAVSSSGEFRQAADVFGSDSGVDCGGDAVVAVDLSRDSDLGFSDVEAVLRESENPSSDANRLGLGIQVVVEGNAELSLLDSEVEERRGESVELIRLNFEGEMAQRQNLASEGNQLDSELGVSRSENLVVELSQRENLDLDANQSKSEGTRVLTRELSLKAGLGESPLKKLKVSERNSQEANEELAVLGDSRIENSFDFHEKAEIEEGSGSLTKRKLELVDDPSQAETCRLGSKTSDDRETISAVEFFEAMNSEEAEQDTVAVELRRLPNSILGRQTENVEENDKGRNEVTIFDVLKLLTEDCVDDTPRCSFLEICKGRGVTFPRPAWWPEHGTGFGDDDMEVESF